MSFEALSAPILYRNIPFFSHSANAANMPPEIKELYTEYDLAQLKPLCLKKTIICLDWLADEPLCDHTFSEEMKNGYNLCETGNQSDPLDNSRHNFRWKKMFFLLIRVCELAKPNILEKDLKDLLVNFLNKIRDKGFPINEHLCPILPVIWAVEENQPALCWALIEMGVDVKSTRMGTLANPLQLNSEPTLIDIAAQKKHVDVIYRLLALGADGRSLLKQNIYLDAKTIKHLKHHNTELNTYFYDDCLNMEVSPFMLAGYHGNTEGMQTLIDLGVKVTQEDYEKMIILCLKSLEGITRYIPSLYGPNLYASELVRQIADPVLSILKTFNFVARQHGFEPTDLPTIEHNKYPSSLLDMYTVIEAENLLNNAVKEKLKETHSGSALNVQNIVSLGKNLLQIINELLRKDLASAIRV